MSYVRMPPTPGELRAANEHITAMETRIEALEEALRPFAAAEPTEAVVVPVRDPTTGELQRGPLYPEDFRNARLMLSTTKEPDHGKP